MCSESHSRVWCLVPTSYSNPILCLWGSSTRCLAGTIFGNISGFVFEEKDCSIISSLNIFKEKNVTFCCNHSSSDPSSDVVSQPTNPRFFSWMALLPRWVKRLVSPFSLQLTPICELSQSPPKIQNFCGLIKVYANYSNHAIRAVYGEPNGDVYAILGDSTCHLWSTSSRNEKWKLLVAMHPSDEVMYVLQHDSSIILVSLDTFHLINCLRPFETSYAAYFLEKDTTILDFYEDKILVLLASERNRLTIRVAQISPLLPESSIGCVEPLYEYDLKSGQTVSYLLFWGYENIVAIIKERCISVLSWTARTTLFTIKNAHATKIIRVDTSCSTRLITISEDGNLRVWSSNKLILSISLTTSSNSVMTTPQMYSLPIEDNRYILFAADRGLYLLELERDSTDFCNKKLING